MPVVAALMIGVEAGCYILKQQDGFGVFQKPVSECETFIIHGGKNVLLKLRQDRIMLNK